MFWDESFNNFKILEEEYPMFLKELNDESKFPINLQPINETDKENEKENDKKNKINEEENSDEKIIFSPFSINNDICLWTNGIQNDI